MKNENLIGNKRTLVNILIDYKNLLDEETWNFVDKTNQLLGSLTGDKSIQFQRENFNKLWKSFSKISPKEIKKVDRLIDDVKIHPNLSFGGSILSGMAVNNLSYKATSIMLVLLYPSVVVF